MSRLRDELTDPWGVTAAVLLGGLAWAVQVPVVAAAGVAVAAYGVKVAAGLAARRGEQRGQPHAPRPLPPPPKGSPGDLLLRRADAAVGALQRLSRTPDSPWLREQIGQVDDDAGLTLESVRRVAGRLAMVEDALAHIDVRALQTRRDSLARALGAADGSGPAGELDETGLRNERLRGLEAVDGQLAAYGRLVTARETLGTRLETAVIGLEGLVTRLHEVIAAGEGLAEHPGSGRSVASMDADLDALRQGLSEVEAMDWPEPPTLPPPTGSARG